MTKGTVIEDAVIKWFCAHGGWARKIHVTPIPVRGLVKGKWEIVRMRKNPKMVGIADVLAVLDGRGYRIEVKAGNDKESLEQEADRKNFEDAGGASLIVKSVEDFLSQVEKFK